MCIYIYKFALLIASTCFGEGLRRLQSYELTQQDRCLLDHCPSDPNTKLDRRRKRRLLFRHAAVFNEGILWTRKN